MELDSDGVAAASQTQVGFEVLWPFGQHSGGVPSQVLGSESASASASGSGGWAAEICFKFYDHRIQVQCSLRLGVGTGYLLVVAGMGRAT